MRCLQQQSPDWKAKWIQVGVNHTLKQYSCVSGEVRCVAIPERAAPGLSHESAVALGPRLRTRFVRLDMSRRSNAPPSGRLKFTAGCQYSESCHNRFVAAHLGGRYVAAHLAAVLWLLT